jgi:hypothetical protein
MRANCPRRSLPRRRFVYPPALVITALVVAHMALRTEHVPVDVRVLHGTTAQGTAFDLGVHAGRVLELATSLAANCGGGTTWQTNWSPSEGNPVHFTSAGRSFSTREQSETSYPDGETGHVAFMLRGRLTGPGAAQGTVRLVARFYYGEQRQSACDSHDVPWAVGTTTFRPNVEMHALAK